MADQGSGLVVQRDALGTGELGTNNNDRFVTLITAGCAMWNIGLAFVLGIAIYHLLQRGWVRL